MVNPIVRGVLDFVERIQGRSLAFDEHPEGGARPSFPVQEVHDSTTCQICVDLIGTEETYFVDDTGEYGPARPGV